MRIILACAAGMSTSLLAANIERLAREGGDDVAVEAVSASALDETRWRGADVVLVGPQMRHLLPTLAAKGAEYGVPVAAIPPRDYAMANAQSVLEQAKALVQNRASDEEAGRERRPS